MRFTHTVEIELDPMDAVLQADEAELMGLVDQALTLILSQEIEINQRLKSKLEYACKALQCCEEN